MDEMNLGRKWPQHLTFCFPSFHSSLNTTGFKKQMAMSATEPSTEQRALSRDGRARLVVVADVLDTLVADPFHNGMAAHLKFDSFEQFLKAKAPNVWVDFELGIIDEMELARTFFKDERTLDVFQFKQFLCNTYQLIPGVDAMLNTLRQANVDVHVCSNYPVWATLIEESVGLESRFGVKWTFVSAHHGVRKPDKRAFTSVANLANVPVSSCVLLDDKESNCLAATDAGFFAAVHFHNAPDTCQQLEHIFSKNKTPLLF